MPFLDFSAGQILTATQVDDYLMRQSVMVFDDASARTTALGTAVAEGMVTYLKDTDSLELTKDGTNWQQINATAQTVEDKSGSFTLASDDAGKLFRVTATATVTVPDVLENGQQIDFIQAGSGQISFGASGVTLVGFDSFNKTAGQYAAAIVYKAGDVYYLIGNLGA